MIAMSSTPSEASTASFAPTRDRSSARRLRTRVVGALLAACLVAPLAGVATSVGAAGAPLRILPQWEPQAQFAGIYVADALGYYEDAGVEVEVLVGGPGRPSLEELAAGRADLVTAWLASAIDRRAEGVPLVHRAQILQGSAQMLVAWADSGIERPEDLDGRSVGLWNDDFRILPTAFFRKYGIEPRVVPQSGTMNLFLHRGVDAASAMRYNEFHLLIAAGRDPGEFRVFEFADHDLDFPEDGLYCLESALASRPAEIAAAVEATLRGWRRAFESPEEAVSIVIRRRRDANLSANRSHQRWMLDRMKELAQPQGKRFGAFDPAAFDEVAAELLAQGLISAVPDRAGFLGESSSPESSPSESSDAP